MSCIKASENKHLKQELEDSAALITQLRKEVEFWKDEAHQLQGMYEAMCDAWQKSVETGREGQELAESCIQVLEEFLGWDDSGHASDAIRDCYVFLGKTHANHN